MIDASRMRPSAHWPLLSAEAERLAGQSTRQLVDADPQRFANFSLRAAGLLLDFSRQRVDATVCKHLCELADQAQLRSAIAAMWRGDPINRSEGRSVLHVALRQPPGAHVGGAQIEQDAVAAAGGATELLSYIRKLKVSRQG